MNPAFLIVLLLVVGAAVLGLLYWYGDRRKLEWYATLISWLGWFAAFSIIAAIPVDVVSSFYNKCVELNGEENCVEPLTYVSHDGLFYFWEIVYWTAFVLTWVAGPFTQSYCTAGGFTVGQKLWISLKENAIIYAVLGTLGICGIVFIVVTQHLDMAGLQGFVMALVNMYGLALVVIFMGYGLVEIPRKLWHLGNRKRMLQYWYFVATKKRDNLEDANEKLLEVLRDVKVLQVQMNQRDELWPLVTTIVAKCPKEIETVQPSSDLNAIDVDTQFLISLHAKVADAVRVRDRMRNEWRRCLKQSFHLQDIEECQDRADKLFEESWRAARPNTQWNMLRRKWQWLWYCRLEVIAIRILAVLCGILSLIIVWSEVTLFVTDPVLSIINLSFHAPGIHSFGVTSLSLLIVTYMCVCAYTSLFKVRIFNYFHLVGNHHTDSNSLLFAAAWLCRLNFPLCYNFAMLANISGTVFYDVLGDMTVLPVFGVGFNVYFPVTVAIVCGMVLFNVLGRLMALCPRAKRFRFDEDFEDSSTEDGRDLIRRAREKADRDPGGDLHDLGSLESKRKTKKSAKDKSRSNELFEDKTKAKKTTSKTSWRDRLDQMRANKSTASSSTGSSSKKPSAIASFMSRFRSDGHQPLVEDESVELDTDDSLLPSSSRSWRAPLTSNRYSQNIFDDV